MWFTHIKKCPAHSDEVPVSVPVFLFFSFLNLSLKLAALLSEWLLSHESVKLLRYHNKYD